MIISGRFFVGEYSDENFVIYIPSDLSKPAKYLLGIFDVFFIGISHWFHIFCWLD